MSGTLEHRHIWRFSLHYWRRRPYLGLGAMVLLLASVTADAIAPIFAGRIVNALTNAPPGDASATKSALFAFAGFVGLNVLLQACRSGSIALWNIFAAGALHDILVEAMHKVQRFSTDWHANTFAGGTVRKMTRGMWSFDQFEDSLFFGIFPAVAIMIGMSAMLAVTVPIVGLFAFVMIAIYFAVTVWLALGFLAPKFRRAAAADTEIGAVLADTITGNATVKAFGAEASEDKAFAGVASKWHGLSLRAWNLTVLAEIIRSTLRMIMMGGMVGLTLVMWTRGTASPGDIAVVLTSFLIISGYLRDLGMHISNLQRAMSEMEDVITFWLREDEVRERPKAQPLRLAPREHRGEIVFDRVRFTYAGANSPIYDAFSLVIRPGERVALVGASGSGKSTFVKLIQRLYDVDDGEIRIDGQNIADVTLASLRRAIALVPQDPILFHRSLAENIAYGRVGADREAIVAAAKQAHAHAFIGRLPLGYETLVGERGVKLSGGERQRVAIARAILADAPILVLDEATSSLDSVAEHAIQEALNTLVKGRTTITIAHRLSTVRKADRILVFEDGRIVEQGQHDDLMSRSRSFYRHLHEMQAMPDEAGQRARLKDTAPGE